MKYFCGKVLQRGREMGLDFFAVYEMKEMSSCVKISKFSFSEYPGIVRCERKRVRYFETLW